MDTNIQPQDVFFALDIGTRSVIGVIGVLDQNELVRILDIESIEHPKRAMIDGQIEDIAQVSKIAAEVKARLEERLGYKLNRVNVAAAGRALKTHKSVGVLELNRDSVIDASTIRSLETVAITKANEELVAENDRATQFFCVGYSVMKYYLDDYQISTLLGHKGEQCKVEMIVTFLPNEVVESLYSAMNMIDLQVESLTLEPIAAMNAVIPSELRGLNLALVDIGAGTSDIAISNDGSVVAYAMATVAGDEITETLTKKYIVDFETAEGMKQSLSLNAADINFVDILGSEYTVSATEVFETVKPALEHLCNVICDKIIEVNEVSPSAVFLVGGASKIPYICGLVADRLGIDQKKVAVGGNKPLKKTVVSDCDIFSPEYVTPIGIAVTAAKAVSSEDLVVTVNDNKVTLFHRSGVTVMDLLLSCGYRYSQMLGTSGKNLIYTLNGEKKIVRGTHPSPAMITVNGKTTSLFMPVNGGDVINIDPAVSGADAEITVKDIVSGSFGFDILLNGKVFTVGTRIMRNSIPLTQNDVIYHGDVIYTIVIRNVFDLCEYLNLDIDSLTFKCGEREINGGYTFNSGDAISYTEKTAKTVEEQEMEMLEEAIIDVFEEIAEMGETIDEVIEDISEAVETAPAELVEEPVFEPIAEPVVEQITAEEERARTAASRAVNEINDMLMKQRVERKVQAPVTPPPTPTPAPTAVEMPVAPTPPVASVAQSEPPAPEPAPVTMGAELMITLNGHSTTLYPKVDGSPYLFLDMLNLVNIDPSKPQGNIVLKHNGEEASFMTPVLNGDTINIHWDRA